MRFFIADAFASELFGGNAAGVVLIPDGEDFPPDEAMRKTAAELRYSETAFVKQLDDGAFRTRYFTPAAEVELCGHATIAAFHVLRESGMTGRGKRILTNSTLAGKLSVRIGEDAIWMDMAAPEFIGTIDAPDELGELYAVMGLDAASDFPRAAATDLRPEIISTGLPDILLPVASKERLDAIAPDFPALAELSRRRGVIGVHAFYAPDFALSRGKDASVPPAAARVTGERSALVTDVSSGAATCFCRNFAPSYGIDEEAATGTANGALTYYLYRRGRAAPGATNIFIQGEAMGRPSRVLTRLSTESGDDSAPPASGASRGVAVKVGGRAVTLASGEIHVGLCRS
jgi:PhzF family phenazine biosynthesis protein